MRLLAALVLSATLAAQTAPAPRWRIKFFHDQDNSSIDFSDLKFVSPRLGIAVGALVAQSAGRSRATGVALVTKDGGNTWTQQKLPEVPRTLFALHEGALWMVAANDGLYRSGDFGTTWKRIASLKGGLRVHFLDEKRGIAVGIRKAVWRSNDGGQKWTPVPEAATPKTKEENSAYTTITAIDAKRLLITGFSRPPRRGAARVPEWMDPDSQPSQVPNVAITLESRDAGLTWSAQTAAVFGQVTRVASTPQVGLSLVEFGEGFSFPSELLLVGWNRGANKRVFREKDRAVKDVALDPLGRGLIVAIERSGSITDLPIPGRLHVLESLDLEKWAEAEVDYKAVANSAVIAIAGETARFIATDTGMILKFE